MVGRWAKWTGIYRILLLNFMICPLVLSDCWESCFVPSERGDYTLEYEQIFQLVTSFRQAMNTDANTGSGTSNGTVFLMDTTMPIGTDDSSGLLTFTLQKRLAQILAFTLPVTSSFNAGFLVNYDGKNAWTCDDWKCLGRCDMFDILESEVQDYTTSTTDDIDLLDDSCELASEAATSSTCYGSTHNIFAIALTNSAFKTAHYEREWELEDDSFLSIDVLTQFGGAEDLYYDMYERSEFNSYCDSHFLKKAILGTLQADSQTMGTFPSASTANWPGYTQVANTPKMVDATNQLVENCLKNSCCSRRKRSASDSVFDGNCLQFQNGQTTPYNASKSN